ncbi:MAG: DUF2442 domain-containing protein [Gammaproteobacteria bacterium]|nr:DUF2442 domain-containing protein [Gammaproteobacteria bacterium]
MSWRVASVHPLPGYILEVEFLDGLKGIVDLSERVIDKNAGIFSKLQNLDVFNQVYLEYGTVTWPGEIDLAPDAMYDEIRKNGKWILRRIQLGSVYNSLG